jgi:hypothetical protein
MTQPGMAYLLWHAKRSPAHVGNPPLGRPLTINAGLSFPARRKTTVNSETLVA